MYPYWLMFSIFGLGALGTEPRPAAAQRVTPFLFVAALMMMLMIGLRWEVGGDWFAYEDIYAIIAQLDFLSAAQLTEPTFGALNWLAARLGMGVWTVNLVCAAVFEYGLVRFARQQPNPWLAIVVAIPFLVIVVAMGYTRQGAAMGIALLALASLKEGWLRKSLLLVFAASTFHRSALILIPVIGFSYSKNRIQTLTLTVVASVIAYYLILDPAVDRYSTGYVQQVYQADGAGFRLAMNIVPAIITLLFAKHLGLEGDDKKLWRNLALLGLAANALYLVVESNVALDRLGIYIIPLQIMVFSRLPATLGRPLDPDGLTLLGVIMYSGLVQYVWLTFASNAEFWEPYRFLPLIH